MKGGGNKSVGYSRELSGSSSASENNACDSLDFIAKLQNIQPVISNHSKGDILTIELDEIETIIATSEHGVCGTISSFESIRTIECLKNGYSYKAIIINVSTSSCEVRVRLLK